MTNKEEWSVYKHTSPDGKIYIGITHLKPETRWWYGYGYKTNHHFWNAIKKHGWDNFSHEIVASGLSQNQAEQMEKDLVREYNSTDKNRGYNVAEGGHALSETSRKKISDTRKARGIKPWNTGKHLSEETKKKISTATMGMKRHTVWTDDQIEAVRQSKLGEKNPNFGKPMPPELKKKLIKEHERPVICIDGNRRTLYQSAKIAEKETGTTACNISRVCRGTRMTAGGFVWEYAEG